MVIAVAIVILLFAQARLLYNFPQPDSSRWWGDETGQMLELRTELQDGFARIPTGLGSSVAITNGLVRGNSWLAAAIYGIPAIVFSGAADLVTIGRTVTFLIALLLLVVMYAVLRTLRVPMLLALAALLLLVSTRSFFFASHAARLDMAAGLAVLAFASYLASRYEQFRDGHWIPSVRWYFSYGIVLVIFATLSIHLVTLLGSFTVYMLWRFRSYRNPSALFGAAGGAVLALAVLLLFYVFSGAPFSLFGPSSASNQFQSVASGLPILRPFSRSVQTANILERLHGLWSEAPAFLALLGFAIVFRRVAHKISPASFREQWITGAAMTIALAWLLFQSPALYYYLQVLPLFIIAIMLSLSRQWKSSRISILSLASLSILLCFLGVHDTLRAGVLARTIERDNHAALSDALKFIESEPKSNRKEKPLVLAQNPGIAWLEHERNIRLMTAHLVGFPRSNAPVSMVLQQLGVNYIILYASYNGTIYSDDYHTLRPIADSFGTVLFRKPGTLFDVHRDYFSEKALNDTTPMDTLILYKLSSFAR
jgi:hypothetical protein